MSIATITRDEPLGDYADHVSRGSYQYAAPADIESLQELVAHANRHRMSVRIRGNGHSMNGFSVPRPGELLVAMENFRQFRIDAPDRVTIGAGASVWDTCCTLEKLGIEMLVYNDGNATASTLGGYLAAGGIGHTCHRYGGFWTTVLSVTVVSGAGEVRVIRKGEPEFPWLFGSYGQLGIVVDLTLAVRPLSGVDSAETGTCGTVETSTHDWESSAWFTVFAPQPLWKVLRTQLREIGERHRHAWKERPLYLYPLPFRDFNPPLLHPHQGALVAVGVWGEAADASAGLDWLAIEGIEREVQALVMANREYRRYLQCERIAPDYDYRAYYGDAIWDRFRFLKQRWDPQGVLVPGMFARDGAVRVPSRQGD